MPSLGSRFKFMLKKDIEFIKNQLVSKTREKLKFFLPIKEFAQYFS